MRLSVEHTSNIEAILAEVQASLDQAQGPSDHVLEVRNTAEYAAYLEAREAYWVVSDEVLEHCANEAGAKRLAERNRAGELLTDTDVVEALEEAADLAVAFYQSTIGTTDKPGPVKLPPRATHPGAWSDDSEELASRYQSRVDDGPYQTYDYD